MSGGHFDTISYVNSSIDAYNEKYHKKKSYAIGFEVDKKHKNRIRFFDKDGETVWLPDKFYEKLNSYMMKNNMFKVTYISNHWKQIATGNYTDRFLQVEQKFKALKKQFILGCKKMFGSGR